MKRLSVNAAAKASGLSRWFIKSAIKRREIQAVMVRPGVFRIAPADLEHWLRARTTGRVA